MRPAWTTCLALALVAPCTACNSDDRTPRDAVRSFVRAVESRDAEKIYELLAPGTRRKLEEMARLATNLTGGGRKFEPHDLLVAGISVTTARPGEITEEKREGDRAVVRITSGEKDKPIHQDVDLIRVEGHWRVVLPDAMFATP